MVRLLTPIKTQPSLRTTIGAMQGNGWLFHQSKLQSTLMII
jgi:hypothetical protein